MREDTLGQPEQWLGLRLSRLNLDYRGIKGAGTGGIDIHEVFSANGASRAVMLGRIPHGQLPTARTRSNWTSAYLG